MGSVNKSVTKTQNYSKQFMVTTVAATNISFKVISDIRTLNTFQQNVGNDKLPMSVPEWQQITTIIDLVNSETADSEFLRGYGVCVSFSSTVKTYSTPHHLLQIVVMFRKGHADTAPEAGIFETEVLRNYLKWGSYILFPITVQNN
jgi:hypothetical protein